MGKTKDVTTETIREVHGTIFDDVFRTIAQKMPYLLIPLINEVFQTNYPEDIHFQQLRNEHYEKLGKIITDSILQIEDHTYHLECQSSLDGQMVIRMFEYDFSIALELAQKNNETFEIEFPQSCVLYIRNHRKRSLPISNVRQNRKGGSVIMPENASCSGAATCSKESCEGCASKQNPRSMLEAMNAYSDIKHVIGVVSGKGGVGKSFVTASLAVKMAKAGYKVGILDADITGPSIPKMFGAHGQVVGDDKGMYPYETKEGIKIISINLLMEDEEAPVVWRGPVIAGAVKQFWNETVWGDVDYLFVDMPPGTGDVPLTVFQSLPVDGIVIVTSPQELVQMIVKKAFNMANMMHIPVLGVVENFSYLKCPDCGKQIKLFGESHIDEVAAGLGTKVLGKLPLDPEYAQHADAGEFYQMENSYLDDAVDVLKNI